MRERVVARSIQRIVAVDPGAAVIVAGLALALYLQGAYYGWAQLIVAVILFAGVLLLPRGPEFGREDVPVALAATGLAGWAVVDGVLKHDPAAGVRYALLIAAVLLFSGCCRQLRGGARTDLVRGLIIVCGLVAALGWVGVVVHHGTWGFESPGLWRASSTLTYPNATAALLAVAALVCLAVRVRDPEVRWLGVAATALTTGLAATLSRAGLLAFGVGAVVLVVGLGWRPVVRVALTPLLGTAVAMAGLLPSITGDTPTVASTGLAVAAALAGLGIGWLTITPRPVLLGPVIAVALAVVAAHTTALGSRFSVDSPDRWDSIRAAWQLFTDNPLTGVGPGLSRLAVERTQGGEGVYRYAHNEYVQVLAELGTVGGVLLVAFLFMVLRRLHRSRANVFGVGVLAGMVAFVVHAGFDFVWHIPAIPLFVAALVGLALPRTDRTPVATDFPREKTERSTT
jgi:O-antigen ligase